MNSIQKIASPFDSLWKMLIFEALVTGTMGPMYYGPDRVRDEMLQERYIDKRALNFLSFYFGIPKTQFRCFTLQQSTPKHWDF